ncbi:hypothetical protein DL240_05420 [Lujinxingia litoralis]|uniref:Uncharacterized protein n=1 Tax=Lujinxingia litoralis TaxID=2211119 RepID=A0A328C7R4_9DELT|nr:hypothetical protein DL240_05420 [Lujinxingia litoralis]
MFRSFVEHLWRGEDAEALNSLLPSTRARLMEPLQEAERALASEPQLSADDMFIVTQLDNPHEIEAVTLDGEIPEPLAEGTRITLKLETLDRRQGEATMVWEDGRWYVDLPLEKVDTDAVLVPLSDEAGEADDAPPLAEPETSEPDATAPGAETDE